MEIKCNGNNIFLTVNHIVRCIINHKFIHYLSVLILLDQLGTSVAAHISVFPLLVNRSRSQLWESDDG